MPAINLPDFARLADTPIEVNGCDNIGSGRAIASVSVTPSIPVAIGGAMIELM